MLYFSVLVKLVPCVLVGVLLPAIVRAMWAAQRQRRRLRGGLSLRAGPAAAPDIIPVATIAVAYCPPPSPSMTSHATSFGNLSCSTSGSDLAPKEVLSYKGAAPGPSGVMQLLVPPGRFKRREGRRTPDPKNLMGLKKVRKCVIFQLNGIPVS